jgi:hypothetical protein
MVAFNTIEELIQILDENPHWLEALRARLLTRELLELPQRHAEFVALVERRYVESAELAERRYAEFVEFAATTNRRFDKLEAGQVAIRNDIGMLKGEFTHAAVLKFADDIAIELGLRRVENLSANQLVDMAESADTTGMFDSPQSRRDNLRSFRRADLIMEARDANGERCYVAVESSYRINGRDTNRAIRNAEYLEKFTKRKAYAAVSGVRLDNRVREIVESGRLFWYEIEENSIRNE